MNLSLPLAVCLGLAFSAGAETLDGTAIAQALDDRSLRYDDGTSQSFSGTGRTLFFARDGSQSEGRWRIEGDQYCSQWPPSEHWACYEVAVAGKVVKFLAADGSETVGGYSDEN